jgi:hypothetical protein
MQGPTAFDIDQVIINFGRAFRDAAEIVLKREVPVVNPKVYFLGPYFGMSAEDMKKVWVSPIFLKTLEVAPILKCGLRAVRQAPPGSMYVTARGCDLQHSNAMDIRMLTMQHLRRVCAPDLPFAFINDKADWVIHHGFTTAYEDAPHHVEELAAAGLKVHMPVYPCNEHLVDLPNVIPEYHWH